MGQISRDSIFFSSRIFIFFVFLFSQFERHPINAFWVKEEKMKTPR